METLPKDVRMKIALDLSPVDLIHFCSSEKKQNEICNSNEFWRNKLLKDYPEEFLDFYENGVPVDNPKEVYIKRFTEVAKLIESYMDDFIRTTVGNPFKEYVNEKYKKDYFQSMYQYYQLWKNSYDAWQEFNPSTGPNVFDFYYRHNEFWDNMKDSELDKLIPGESNDDLLDEENPFEYIKKLMQELYDLDDMYNYYREKVMKYIKKTE